MNVFVRIKSYVQVKFTDVYKIVFRTEYINIYPVSF